MDRDMMDALNEMGFLYEEYYGTPEAEGLEREEEIPLPPCVAPFAVAMKAASRVMYTMEQTGQTEHPAYAVAKTAVERGLEALTAGAFELMFGIFGDNPYGMRPMDDTDEAWPYGGILAATGENAGHAVLHGSIFSSEELKETPPCLKGLQGYATLVGKQLSPAFIGALEDGLIGPCHGTGLVGSQGESRVLLFKPETHNHPTMPGEPPYNRDKVESGDAGARPRHIKIHGPPEGEKPPGSNEH